jgi:glycosyltransferase involved in cell wall biosynthesis
VNLFLRSSAVAIDSKLRRYCRGLRAAGIDHRALFWDRDSSIADDAAVDGIRFVHPQCHHGKLDTALALIRFNWFALRRMWHLRRQMSLVHAIDLDSVGAALLLHRLTGIPFIYDIYDHYPDSRGITGRARMPFNWLERMAIARASLVIIADESRLGQHDTIPAAKLMVVENVPDADQAAFNATPPVASPRLRIGYLGTFEPRFRGLEDMLAVVAADPRLELHIGGTGALEPAITAAAAACPRIICYGPMAHGEGLAMLAGCDILLGLYYRGVPNHRYAAPNKYYEHLLLGRPMLTSAHTPPGDKVRAADTGWVVEDGPAPITAALADAIAHPAALMQKGERARALWQRDYADYFARVIAGDYVAAVRRIAAAR